MFALARYCPTSEEKDTGITPLEYRELLAVCDEKFKAYEAAGCETYFNKKDHLWTLYEYETGAAMLREWGVPEDYIARCFVLLGYVRGEYPGEKPRRAGRCKIVEG